MDGSPEAATGTSAWPSFRRAKRLRRLNNPHSPRRSGAAGALVWSRVQADNTEAVAVPQARQEFPPMEVTFPREALEPGSRAAPILRSVFGRDFGVFGL